MKEKALAIYRQIIDLYKARLTVQAAFDSFPKREITPQNAPERHLRHILEMYDRQFAELSKAHCEAIRCDVLTRRCKAA